MSERPYNPNMNFRGDATAWNPNRFAGVNRPFDPNMNLMGNAGAWNPNRFAGVNRPFNPNVNFQGLTQRQPAASDMGAFSGPMIDPETGASTVPTPEPTPANPMLDLLYQMFNQAGQGSGGRAADLSGYNASLKMLGRERKRMKKRYKKYEGQIADIYGTLTGINKSMIENIAPAGEAMRADLAAQEGQQAAATRSADAARLEAATQARAELGLEDLAGQYAGGDVATEQAEGMITDRAADTTAAQNTLLANEAIARQQLTNQNLGRTIQEESSTRDLQRSLEDALAAIRGERANVLTQRAQARSAAGGGSGPNLGAQLSILEQIQAIEAGQPATDPVGMFIQNNPSLAPVAGPLVNSFADWVSDNYTDLFNRSGTAQKVNPLAAIERFKASSPEARTSLNQSPLMLTLLSQYYNSVAAPKAQ
jgi:hypothetical protein